MGQQHDDGQGGAVLIKLRRERERIGAGEKGRVLVEGVAEDVEFDVVVAGSCPRLPLLTLFLFSLTWI
jgi:hypothetical protein